VRPEVQDGSDREVQARFVGMAWTQCDSWYRNRSGRHVANWLGYMSDYIERTRRLDADEYTFVPRLDHPA